MRAVGLITEYNPFHNGHMHHLHESLRVTGAQVSVAVMSGHFLQRGEPALVDKWVRAKMALRAGVDLVVELPLPWATSSAPNFALGAVQSLASLGVDSLCFGSEVGVIDPLLDCADYLLTHDSIITGKTSELLRQGMNYPQAREKIISTLMADKLDPKMVSAPNNILGIEYLKALKQVCSQISPATIKRIGAGYNDVEIGACGIASATGIRKQLGLGESVANLLPPVVVQELEQRIVKNNYFSADKYFQLLLGQIFNKQDELQNCWLVENGIENRILKVAETANLFEELIVGIKSKQLTRTRIQRILVSILLGMDKTTIPQLYAAGPQYLHLLAVSEKGRQFLAHSRKHRSLPLVQNFSRVYAVIKRFYGEHHQLALQQLEMELRATKIYTLLVNKYTGGSRNRDFFEPLITEKK